MDRRNFIRDDRNRAAIGASVLNMDIFAAFLHSFHKLIDVIFTAFNVNRCTLFENNDRFVICIC